MREHAPLHRHAAGLHRPADASRPFHARPELPQLDQRAPPRDPGGDRGGGTPTAPPNRCMPTSSTCGPPTSGRGGTPSPCAGARDAPARRRPGPRDRAVRRRAVGDAPARRPRRRGDQDRGPLVGRGRGPLRPPVPGGRGLALLRDVQPQQEEHLARSPPSGRARRARGSRPRGRRRLLEPARRPPEAAADHVRRPEGREPAHRLLLPLRLRHDRSAGGRGRLRLHDAGPGGVDEPHRGARRAADEERALPRRPLGRLRLRDRA